jgi:hypothetical protein
VLGIFEESPVIDEGTRDFFEINAAESPSREGGLLTLPNWDAGADGIIASGSCEADEGLTSEADLAVEFTVR